MSATVLPLDRVLALRPENATARLGPKSKLPVLTARELLAVLPPGIALGCLPVFSDEAVPALLKASRDEDAALGVGLPWPLGEGDVPVRTVTLLAEEAESVRHRAPLFLQAGPFVLDADAAHDEAVQRAVEAYVEAGFTHVCLDARGLEPARAEGVARILSPALERSLSVELVPPLGADGKWEPARAHAFLEALSAQGVTPTFLRVPSSAYGLREDAREVYELDLSVLEAAGAVAQAHGAALSVAQTGKPTTRLIRTLCAAGVRKIDVEAPFAQAVLQSWPKEASDLLKDEATAQGLPIQRLVRRLAVELGVEVNDRARARSEAAQWGAAHDLLEAVGGRGTGSLCVARLAEGRG